MALAKPYVEDRETTTLLNRDHVDMHPSLSRSVKYLVSQDTARDGFTVDFGLGSVEFDTHNGSRSRDQDTDFCQTCCVRANILLVETFKAVLPILPRHNLDVATLLELGRLEPGTGGSEWRMPSILS